MSQRDFSEVEPSGNVSLPAASRALFVEKVRASNAACQAGDFQTAVALYTDALGLDPTNHILYSNRSAARLKQGQFAAALQDAVRAKELCPTWPKAYYRQGVALQCMGRHGEALAAFSSGLAQEPTSRQLLSALVEASLKSPLRATLHPTFQQLEAMKLNQSPFVLISVVGQELLAAGKYHAAVTVLEAALRIGSCSLKLRGSVFSALSSAHWALSQLDAAINYMQQDLAIAKSLGDTAGECRAHGNLGAAYFSQGSYKEALTAHRYQLVLAMKCKDTQAAAAALTSLGHVYTAIGDYPNALASHKQCVQLVKQMGDRLQEAREIGNVGAVYLAMGEFDSALDCHTQHLRIATRLANQVEEARAYSNLGSSHHYRRNFAQAIAYHEKVLRIAQNLGDRAVEARAYAGLGHAARCGGDYVQAKKWHERQLDVALAARDKVGEGRACSNLGIVYQLLGEHDAALKLHQAHLSIARSLQDRAGMGRAYGNIGNAYSAAGFYEQAIKYHRQELTISKEVHDRSSEASTHGNLAVAYQALGAHDMALLHYRAHLGIARELKDAAGEACALLNLGNCLSSRQEFAQAIPFYEQHLMLSQELGDVAAEAKACHFLGYAHYCIGNYREAVRYYDQDLSLAKDLQDKMNMGRAYCNLGLAHLALGNLETALECQKYFLAIAHMTQYLPGKFRALGNIGDVLIKMGDVEEAVKMYQRQLGFARQARDRNLEAAACGALGLARRLQRRLDAALGHHTQELTLRQESGDIGGEARAHAHLGAVHMALANYTHAVKCYQEQLERAQELQDATIEAQAYGNLGIARLNMGHYEDAIGYLEQQLATLERLNTSHSLLDKARALGSLGDCYDALGDPEEALKFHDQHLAIALTMKNPREEERAYRGLGLSYRSLNNLQQALVCLEKRLVVSHELGSPEAKAQAYGELGNIHTALGNLEQAVSCLEHQRNIARELNDRIMESDSVSALGVVYQQMGEYSTALRYHQMDLESAHQLGLAQLQARACGNLGAAHEALGAHAEAARWQEARLRHATASGDARGRAAALASLGRAHLAMGAAPSAVGYLQQALTASETVATREEEARIRHRLGFALWACGNREEAHDQLQTAASLLESPINPASNRVHINLIVDKSLLDGKLRMLHTSTHEALQRVLVDLGRHSEALVVAEKSRSRTIIEMLQDKQSQLSAMQSSINIHGNPRPQVASSPVVTRRERTHDVWTPQNVQQLLDIINRQKSPVLYYSLAAGHLYAWFIVPTKGIVKFHQVSVSEEREVNSGVPNIGTDDLQTSSATILEHYIQSWHESLQTELQKAEKSALNNNPADNPAAGNAKDDSAFNWDRSSQQDDMPNDRTGFLRMINRNHLLNSSNYSLSSLFSVGSVGGSVASLQGSTRSSSSVHSVAKSRGRLVTSSNSTSGNNAITPETWAGPACLNALYQLLLAPFEDVLPTSSNSNSSVQARRELIIVPDGQLYVVPWAVLRNSNIGESGSSGSSDYLCDRYSLLCIPSLAALRGHRAARHRTNLHDARQEGAMRSLVVGNPRLPANVSTSYGWQHSSSMQKEALMIADMLHSNTLTDIQASKEALLAQISEAECIHLSTHVSWKMSALVLSPGEMVDSQSQSATKRFLNTSGGSGQSDTLPGDGEEDGSELSGNIEMPPLSEFLLTASDILNLKLSARLVVISSSNTVDDPSAPGCLSTTANQARSSKAPPMGLAALTRALLEAGAQCVMVNMWPAPTDTANKILLRAFYSALLQGSRVARALGDAMQTVQHTKHFAHPANWAGFMLIGANVRLSNKVAMMGQALCDLLKTPEKCRDALRVSLHLVEKSLQRIVRGQKNAMYTTQKSIENKVGSVNGWKELLMSVGFRFEPAANGIPSSVFFPQNDPEERLTQCSASLQALLGLTPTSLQALSKLISNVEVADDIIGVIRNVISQFSLKNGETESIDIAVSVRLWRVNGCHELLASLGFDLMEVGQDEVTLRTGKQANRRNIQFVLQALLALFDTQEAPRSLGLDSSSSLESLASIEKGQLEPQSDGELHRATSSPNLTQSSLSLAALAPPPPFTAPPILLGSSRGGAFTSYVRHRGEPDGRTANAADSTPAQARTLPHNSSSSINLSTDSDLSDSGYGNVLPSSSASAKFGTGRNDLQNQSHRSNHSKIDFRTGERPPIKVTRPGGGGESDAAFTPSPPVALQHHVEQIANGMSPNVSLALAHQTKIRNLYHAAALTTQTLLANRNRHLQNQQNILDNYGLNIGLLDDVDLKNATQVLNSQSGLRPDSSSSAGSATDWEGSGHATVLRRNHGLPPPPPPRQVMSRSNGPLVENLHPLPPVYNNLSASDNNFDRNFEHALANHIAGQNVVGANSRLNLNTLYKSQAHNIQRIANQVPLSQIDKVSFRADLSCTLQSLANTNSRKFNSDSGFANDMFYNTDISNQHTLESKLSDVEDKSKCGKELSQPSNLKQNIQDSIIAMRNINRELTPTISEVYHERSIGLGLAPPLAKLLLTQSKRNQESALQDHEGNLMQGLEKFGIVDENSILNDDNSSVQNAIEGRFCDLCSRPIDHNSSICSCKAIVSMSGTKTTSSKPWLTNMPVLNSGIVDSSDLTTAEIIERQAKLKIQNQEDAECKSYAENLKKVDSEIQNSSNRAVSPFSEMSRRDEGDGRSIADSHSSYNGMVLGSQSKLLTSGKDKHSNVFSGVEKNEGQVKMDKSTQPRIKTKTTHKSQV